MLKCSRFLLDMSFLARAEHLPSGSFDEKPCRQRLTVHNEEICLSTKLQKFFFPSLKKILRAKPKASGQAGATKTFHVILIKPSKYDDDGYVVRWWRGIAPSNTLACLNALTAKAAEDQVLGPDVRIEIRVLDETVQKVEVRKLCREAHAEGGTGVVCMVGVQTNQYARGLDLALEFKKEGLACMIGGFHVSGILAMLPEKTPEIQEAIDKGITLVAGEVEFRWPELLRAAYEGRLAPVYDFLKERPDLRGAPSPFLPNETARLFLNLLSTFDTGRGCPYRCSFCSVINVQGHTMRGRSVEDVEKMVRRNHARGYRSIFFTDDNFARRREWEEIADRLIRLKEEEGIRCSLMIQVDTMAHKIPRFIEKMTRAGVRRVFIGLETVNAENLRDVGKSQNQIREYRGMMQMWRDHGAVILGGYIIGFPNDTYESIMRDVDFLKKELPMDLAEFYIMTPLPGSCDHKKYYLDKVPMAADTNLYDTSHVAIRHPRMTDDELIRAYRDAWRSFYGKEHCRTLLMRRKGPRRRILFSQLIWFRSSVFLSGIDPFLGGFFRLKGRRLRRPGYATEPLLSYYGRRFTESLVYLVRLLGIVWEVWRLKAEADRPENAGYVDEATRPVEPGGASVEGH